MAGRKAYAENFVRYYWMNTAMGGNSLEGDLYCLGGFAYLMLCWAQMGRHYATASFLIALVVSNGIIVARLKQRGGELDYFQWHLLQGYEAVVRSLSILLYPVVYVEQSGNTRVTLLFFGVMMTIWVLILLLHLLIPWWNIHREKTYIPRELDEDGLPVATEEQKQRWMRSFKIAVGLVVVCAGVYLAFLFPRLGKAGIAINILLLDIFVGAIFSVGISALLKAYYIKKYSIQGRSFPAYIEMSRPTKSLPKRIVKGILKWTIITILVVVQVVGFVSPH